MSGVDINSIEDEDELHKMVRNTFLYKSVLNDNSTF